MKKGNPITKVLALLIVCSACSPRSGDPITVIIPDGYMGVFKIAENKRNGKETGKEMGRFVYEIPESGILTVKDMSPFEVFHETIVRTQGGREFPNGLLEMSKETFGFYYLWTNTEGTTWFLIGTDHDYQAAQKSGRVRIGPDFLPQTD